MLFPDTGDHSTDCSTSSRTLLFIELETDSVSSKSSGSRTETCKKTHSKADLKTHSNLLFNIIKKAEVIVIRQRNVLERKGKVQGGCKEMGEARMYWERDRSDRQEFEMGKAKCIKGNRRDLNDFFRSKI